MSEDSKTLQEQLNDKLVDLRNDAIVQGANLYLVGRKVVLVSIGAAALAVEQACRLAARAEERGEVAASAAQKRAVGAKDKLMGQQQTPIARDIPVTPAAPPPSTPVEPDSGPAAGPSDEESGRTASPRKNAGTRKPSQQA